VRRPYTFKRTIAPVYERLLAEDRHGARLGGRLPPPLTVSDSAGLTALYSYNCCNSAAAAAAG